MPNPTVSYTPHGGISAKLEASILASIYALALQKSKDEKEAADPGSLDDARKDEDAGTCSNCT
jgi:hypothetical protein